MVVKKYVFIVLILGSLLSMAAADNNSDTPYVELKEKSAAQQAPAASSGNQLDLKHSAATTATQAPAQDGADDENPITDEFLDQEPYRSMWAEYHKKKKLEEARAGKLKEAEQKRDEEEAQAKKDGKARPATGGAGPSGS
jgi:hypothetical protein